MKIEDQEDSSQEGESDDEEDDAAISIHHLIQNEQEKVNFVMLNHTIYSEDVLFKLA